MGSLTQVSNAIRLVVFHPELDKREKAKRNELFTHLQVRVAPHLFNPRLVYDGAAIAYSPGLLNLGGNSGITFNVSLGSGVQTAAGIRGSYRITLNLTSSPPIDPSHIKDLIVKHQSSTRAATATNLIQLVIRQGTNQYHTNNGRSYFTGKDRKPLKYGIELWHGIFSSVRPTIDKMVLTIDTSTAAVYQSGPLIDVALNFLQKNNVRFLALSESSIDFKRLEKFLKRLHIKVITGAGGSKSRIKTIRGLKANAGRFAFQIEGRGTTTVNQYFATTHGIYLQHPDIIGVRLTGKNSAFQDIVPAELCVVERGQLFRQKIPEEFTSEMVRFSTLKPQVRLEQITGAASEYSQNVYLSESGMSLDARPIQIDGKILPAQMVQYGPRDRVRVNNGAWNLNEQLGKDVYRTFYKPASLESWGIVNFCPARINVEMCMGIADAMRRSCTRLGMRIHTNSKNFEYSIFSANGYSVEKDLDHAIAEIKRKLFARGAKEMINNTILVILLPSSGANIRTAVKHWGDVKHGIKTQCLSESKLKRLNGHYYWDNVALKLNARLGGINVAPISRVINMLQRVPYMIMGIDVGHPGPGVQKPSITSLVYSTDRYATKYVALTAIQNPRTEIVEDLRVFTEKALSNFARMNSYMYPANVVVFRDGVSEGEYEAVAQREIAEIKAAFQNRKIYRQQEPLPKLTFIIVTKRHHVLFFSTNSKTDNCPPGSVIDSGITHPTYRNFYLQSHAAIQGILEDEIFDFDLSKYIFRLYLLGSSEGLLILFIRIQDLSYSLCHVYAKAARSVSIPAPVYYADLVCARGAFHISPDEYLNFDESASMSSGHTAFDLSLWKKAFKPANENISQSMYFL
ncbi:Piwi-domain-containing protein [Pholiota conissans]|uniref:Piwi-domain-containing protein n=1 Tax=Pholiota conissans TaxID=109636 RepID=A0A9P6D755_9AGAR|nr:Piwi-domain-containing protein [Pholiota conissans]